MTTMSAKKVATWIAAHPTIKIPEEVLATCGPWPSLEVGDFLVWAREQEDMPPVAIKMVEDLYRELLWVYAGWTKSVATDAQNMLIDLLHNARGSDEYNFTQKFLRDYAHANGLFAELPKEEPLPPWLQGQESGGTVPPQPPLPRKAIDAGNVEPPRTKE